MLSDIPIVTVSGVDYYEFILDVNEADRMSIDKYVSLDEVQIFVGGTANASFDTFTAGILQHDGTLVYQMDEGSDSWVALDFQLNMGSGSGDMQLLVETSLFAGFDADSVVTLYSEFGQQGINPDGVPMGDYGQSDGFEEWALGEGGGGTTPPVPEPSAALVFGLGAVLMGAQVQRRR